MAFCSFVYFFSFFVLFLLIFFVLNIDLFIYYLTLLSYFSLFFMVQGCLALSALLLSWLYIVVSLCLPIFPFFRGAWLSCSLCFAPQLALYRGLALPSCLSLFPWRGVVLLSLLCSSAGSVPWPRFLFHAAVGFVFGWLASLLAPCARRATLLPLI